MGLGWRTCLKKDVTSRKNGVQCGKIVESSEFFWIEVPIKTSWPELNEQFECVSKNIVDTEIQHLIGILVHAGTAIDFEIFRP